jgi:hypothetical protein
MQSIAETTLTCLTCSKLSGTHGPQTAGEALSLYVSTSGMCARNPNKLHGRNRLAGLVRALAKIAACACTCEDL